MDILATEVSGLGNFCQDISTLDISVMDVSVRAISAKEKINWHIFRITSHLRDQQLLYFFTSCHVVATDL